MMKKLLSICLAAVIACASLGFAGCKEEPADFDSLVELWTQPISEKVLADKEYAAADRQAPEIAFEMAKGEYENAQLILSAKRDVGSIEVRTADLKSGESTIPKENVEVLFQKYVKIDKMSNPLANFPFGMYPDAIVPIEAIQEKGEDVIEKGKNQGLYFTLKTPADCKAGEYLSNFTVTVDGQSRAVPVKVKIWDFVVPQETHAKSMFNNFRDYLVGGELDNTEAMYEKYFEYLLDYRISLHDMPQFDDSVEGYVEQAKKYAADPRCSAYNMKFYYVGYQQINVPGVINKLIYETDWQKVYDRLYALAEASTTELNLFDKLYLMDQSIDEPEGTNRVEEANYKNMRFIQLLDELVANLKTEGFDFEGHGLTEQDILKTEFVVTNAYTGRMPDLRSFCPTMNAFATEEQRAKYEQLREEDPNKTTWWYVCWTPQYPYANYRIEESLLGSRVILWMQKEYDINGLLYWGTSVYNKLGSAAEKQVRDCYNDPWSFLSSSADGYVTYPGRPYGIDGPVSSLRLEAIRDGFEDYEYLWYLEQKLGEASVKYGQSFDFNKIMSSINNTLFTGVIPNYNGESFTLARREVAEMIELLSGDYNAIVNVSETDTATNNAVVELYADAGTSVKIDGNVVPGAICGDGLKFSYTKKLTEQTNYASIEFTKGGKTSTVEKFVGKKINPVAIVSDGAVKLLKSNGYITDPKDHITLAKNADNAALSANAVKISIAKYETEDESAALFYSPEISISKSSGFAGMDVSQFDTFECVLFNGNSGKRKVRLYFNAGSQQQKFLDIELDPGRNTVSLKQVYLSSWTNLGKTDRISFVFESCASSAADVYYLDNVYFTIR